MPNDSTTGGAITTINSGVNYNHVLHDWIVSLTGYNNTLVRPMYQPNQPSTPAFGVDWIAFNLKQDKQIGFSSQSIDANGDYNIRLNSVLILSVVFTGTNSYENIKLFRSSLSLTQNADALRQYNIAINDVGMAIRTPALYNLRWIDKYTIDITLNMIDINKASIMSILDAKTSILQ